MLYKILLPRACEMSKILTIVALVASFGAQGDSHLVADEIKQFLLANGQRRITIASHQNSNCSHHELISRDPSLLQLHRTLSKSGKFYTRIVPVGDYDEVSQGDFHVFPPESLTGNLSEVANVVSKTKVKMSLLILDGTRQDIFKLSQIFAERKRNFFFYSFTAIQKEFQWFQVIIMKTGFSVNKIHFLDHMVINDTYFNLNGLKLRSLDLDWYPYLWVSDCANDNKGCKVKGFIVDMIDLIAKQLNFTYESAKEPNGVWGNEMVDNSLPNMNWTGVMGGVITGQYDLTLSAWRYTKHRSRFVSVSTFITSHRILVTTPNVPNIDFGLFIRPLTASSWKGIVGVTLIIISISLIIKSEGLDEAIHHKIFTITAWLFFLLLNAYYGGAMTMFFANDITLPFKNIRDVMRTYPEWKLLMMQGTEISYVPYVEMGDPDYGAFMDRVSSNPEDLTFNTMEEGIARLRNGRTVIYVPKEGFNSFINSNTNVMVNQRLLVFGKHKESTLTGIMFTLNSPLTPLFDRVILRLREGGACDFLKRRW